MSTSQICSMTSFARVERQLAQATLIWELKSVNHRYLEVGTRLPEAFRDLDIAARERCRKHLGRGKIECSLRYQLASGESASLALNEALVKELAEAAHRVEALMNHPAPINVAEIMRFPGVLGGNEVDLSALQKDALALLDEGLKALVESRAREGEALRAMIAERLEQVLVQIERARVALPSIIAALRERLTQRVADVIESPDPQRLEQEVVIFAQKMDVAEEMDRLQAHVVEVGRTLEQGGNCGRRLDFLMQELNREANTLGSKSVDTETTQASVELKVLIEQMREQIQNIE
jgi:uncharacterized protein (TIGR00255 family)